MAIVLNKPLRWKTANPDELKLLENLQGNILKGHGRHFTANVFIQFDPAKKVECKRMLRELGNLHVTSAHRQLLDTASFQAGKTGGGGLVHVALASKGYDALGLTASAPADVDFKKGMKDPTSIAALTDPAVNTWEAPFQLDIHALVLIAHENEAKTAALVKKLVELITDAGAKVVHIQHGKALLNAKGDGIEHFGYVDGRSQPLLLAEDIDHEAANGGIARWDPTFPLTAALVPDPGVPVPAGEVNTSFGSFFIFRKLEQAVRAFKTREQQIADTLGLVNDARESAGAMIVGRFEDGTPVTQSNTAQGLAPINDFNYTGDPGSRCPFHAHIRKVNPRGTGGAEPVAQERLHIMPRRGIPFEDVKRAIHPDELPESSSLAEFLANVAPKLPVNGVGLLFMAYNAVLGQQFKFTQQTWANNPNFPIPGTHGIDPVIGQGTNAPGAQVMPKEWDNPAASTNAGCPFAGFVTMKGGEYFFSPSLSFLKSL